jgi:dUTP pyrophosphatase
VRIEETKLLGIPCVAFVRTHKDAQLPEFKTAGAAGADLRTVERLTLRPGELALVDTGLKMQLPKGYEAQIRPRSGLALKHGITVLNSPGTIDSDYRGPVKVLLINLGKEDWTCACPDRIAQIVISKTAEVVFVETQELEDTERGESGFGSSGK